MNYKIEDEIVIGIDNKKSDNEIDNIINKKYNNKKNDKKINNKNNKSSKNKSNNTIKQTNNNRKNNKVEKKSTLKNKKIKDKLIFFLFIILIILILFFLGTSRLFYITNVEIENNSRVTEDQINEILDLNYYSNIFLLNSVKIKQKIKENNAYVDEVKISKILPNTLRIDIKEKIPKFMIQFADSFIYINSQGYMLEVSTDNINLPIIIGIKTDLSNIEIGKRLDIEDLQKLENVIKIMETATSNDVSSYITKIDISDEKNYALTLESEQKIVYLGDCSNLNTKMLYLNGMLKNLKNTAGEIFLNMDLNTENAYFREKT